MSNIIFKQGKVSSNNLLSESNYINLPNFSQDGTLLFAIDDSSYKQNSSGRKIFDGSIYLDKVETVGGKEEKYTVDLTGGHYPKVFVSNASNCYLYLKDLQKLSMPIATKELSGIITAADQSFGGEKTFSTIKVDRLIVNNEIQLPGDGIGVSTDAPMAINLNDTELFWSDDDYESRISKLENTILELQSEIKSLKGE